MRNSIVPVAVMVFALGSCRGGEVVSGGPAPEAAPPPETADLLPVGSDLVVELDETLSTETNQTGDRFTATVKDPLVAQNGDVAVPRGATVRGVITGLDESDELGDQAAIRLAFESLEFDGETHPLSAAIVDTDVDVETRDGIEDVAREAGIGAAAGAALGAILGGDLSDILTGAILGAGAGTIISLGTGDVDAALPAGSDLKIRTTRAVSLN